MNCGPNIFGSSHAPEVSLNYYLTAKIDDAKPQMVGPVGKDLSHILQKRVFESHCQELYDPGPSEDPTHQNSWP